MQPGLVERPEYAYLRHGTQGLIANFDVATGEVVAPTIGPSRTEEDFAGPITRTLATAPEAPWLFIVDQLHIHKSEALVRLVAESCGITEDLGEKEQRVVYLSPADKYHRLTRRPSQGQKGLEERALRASLQPSAP
jgi:DDE superfamily endonuclease